MEMAAKDWRDFNGQVSRLGGAGESERVGCCQMGNLSKTPPVFLGCDGFKDCLVSLKHQGMNGMEKLD